MSSQLQKQTSHDAAGEHKGPSTGGGGPADTTGSWGLPHAAAAAAAAAAGPADCCSEEAAAAAAAAHLTGGLHGLSVWGSH
ncbi:hypothetical protein Emag_007097 [Eimeria magna]